jgi:hypothetical protein
MKPLRLRWIVIRWVAGRPYRVEVPLGLVRVLERAYCDFVRMPRCGDEIEAMLHGLCDCPVELLTALRMTLMSGLVLAYRPDRRGRLVDFTVNPRMEYLTAMGSEWLMEQELIDAAKEDEGI